ncbi:MAG: hypothetical protein IIT50_00245, partial [Bacteroidales bacterium]|nr:hypothetical protein [Bacteroidales bacterium]
LLHRHPQSDGAVPEISGVFWKKTQKIPFFIDIRTQRFAPFLHLITDFCVLLHFLPGRARLKTVTKINN